MCLQFLEQLARALCAQLLLDVRFLSIVADRTPEVYGPEQGART
jgi:hypothetical protein